jgi:hypothetical protein
MPQRANEKGSRKNEKGSKNTKRNKKRNKKRKGMDIRGRFQWRNTEGRPRSRSQAIAIRLSEARREGGEVPKAEHPHGYEALSRPFSLIL